MPVPSRLIDYLGAGTVVAAFGGLLLGRVLMYPVAFAPGEFLDRLAAEPTAWDISHRVMTVAAVLVIPAAFALRRALVERAGWLAEIATTLVVLAGALGVGQFALDYAMLAAAQLESRAAGQEFVNRLREHPFVDLAFYELANPAWIGVGIFALALARQGRRWWPAATVVLAAFVFTIFQDRFAPHGPRIALAMQFVGFSLAAWQMVERPSEPASPEPVSAQPLSAGRPSSGSQSSG